MSPPRRAARPRTAELLAELVLEVRGARNEIRTALARLTVLEDRIALLEASGLKPTKKE